MCMLCHICHSPFMNIHLKKLATLLWNPNHWSSQKSGTFHANNYLSCENMLHLCLQKNSYTFWFFKYFWPFDSLRLPIVKWIYVWVHNHWRVVNVFNNCIILAFTLNKWCTYHNWYPKLHHQKFKIIKMIT